MKQPFIIEREKFQGENWLKEGVRQTTYYELFDLKGEYSPTPLGAVMLEKEFIKPTARLRVGVTRTSRDCTPILQVHGTTSVYKPTQYRVQGEISQEIVLNEETASTIDTLLMQALTAENRAETATIQTRGRLLKISRNGGETLIPTDFMYQLPRDQLKHARKLNRAIQGQEYLIHDINLEKPYVHFFRANEQDAVDYIKQVKQ